MRMIIGNGKVILPDRILTQAGIEIEDGRIKKILRNPKPKDGTPYLDACGKYISPGFIDTHVHGGGGADIMDGTAEAIIKVAWTHMKYGMTSFVPTTLTSPPEKLQKAIRAVEEASSRTYLGARILGIHLEGPYLSETFRGAQNVEHLAIPSIDHYLKLTSDSPMIKKVSMAPELDGSMELAQYLREKGITVCVAHSDADFCCMMQAAQSGFEHITHIFNGMCGIKNPDYYCRAGVIESGLLLDGYTAEIIADGKHMPAEMLKLLYKCKGKENMMLTTDAMRAVDMPMGLYDLGGLEVLIEDGVAILSNRTSFAGSIATANRLVQVAYKAAQIPLVEAIAMVTYNQAKHIGVHNNFGSIDKDKVADLVIFDENINIDKVIQGGCIVYENKDTQSHIPINYS